MEEIDYSADTRDELEALQRVFFSLVTSPLLEGDILRDDERIARLISPNARLSEKERIELYAQQYWWRVIPSLEEDFSGVQALLGHEAFRKLVKQYLIAFPSSSFTLRHLGRRFPEFLHERFRHTGGLTDLPKERARLAYELALLEHYQIESFFAEEIAKIENESLSKLTEQSRLIRQPHVRLMESHCSLDVLSQWITKPRSKDNESNATTLKPEETEVEPSVMNYEHTNVQELSYLLIYRFEGTVYAKTVSILEYEILQTLATPNTLEELISKVAKYSTTEVADLGQAFENLGKLGIIAASQILRQTVTEV